VKPSLSDIEGANAWTVTDMHTKKNLIKSGLGWGRLPKYLIEKELADGSLIRLDYPHIQHKDLVLSIIRKRDAEHGPIAQ